MKKIPNRTIKSGKMGNMVTIKPNPNQQPEIHEEIEEFSSNFLRCKKSLLQQGANRKLNTKNSLTGVASNWQQMYKL